MEGEVLQNSRNPWSGVFLCTCDSFGLREQRETPDQGFFSARAIVSVCASRQKLLHVRRKTPDQGFLSARAEPNYRTCIWKPLIRGFLNFATLRIPYASDVTGIGVYWPIFKRLDFPWNRFILPSSGLLLKIMDPRWKKCKLPMEQPTQNYAL